MTLTERVGHLRWPWLEVHLSIQMAQFTEPPPMPLVDVWFFFTPDGGTTFFVSIPIKNATT
jgi:hypothetical protein